MTTGTQHAEREDASPTAPEGPRDDASGLVSRLQQWVAQRSRPLIAGLVGLAALLFIASTGIHLGRVIVEGLAAGGVIALVALGIALVYRSTGVLNFTQGELGTVPAFFVLMLLTSFDLSATISTDDVGFGRLALFALLAMALGAAIAVGINVLVVQRIKDGSTLGSLVATAGVALLFIGAQLIIFEAQVRRFPRFIDDAPCLSRAADGTCEATLRVFGAQVSWQTIVVLAVLGIAAAALAVLFRTPIGVALLATAQEPFAAELHGVSPRTMSSLAWGLAGALGAIAGILGAGEFELLAPGRMTSAYLIPAFTAAVLGGITSMVGAVLGGLLIGILSVLANTMVITYGLSGVPSPPDIVVFTVLLLVLIFRPRGLLGKES